MLDSFNPLSTDLQGRYPPAAGTLILEPWVQFFDVPLVLGVSCRNHPMRLRVFMVPSAEHPDRVPAPGHFHSKVLCTLIVKTSYKVLNTIVYNIE